MTRSLAGARTAGDALVDFLGVQAKRWATRSNLSGMRPTSSVELPTPLCRAIAAAAAAAAAGSRAAAAPA